MNDWRCIVKPQLKKIINSELFKKTDNLFVYIFYENSEDIFNLKSYLSQFENIKIEYSKINKYEFPSLSKIKELSKFENFYCWYMHSKGAVSYTH